jgi:hypothetical protein
MSGSEARIAKIIRLEQLAKVPESNVSDVRWQAAKLYWEEHHSGTPQKEISERVGKSQPHVCYMIKCWDICGRLIDGSALPEFQSIYHSSEVRGPSFDEDRPHSGGQRERRRPRPDDIHTRVAKLGWLADAIEPDAGALTAQDQKDLRHHIRTLERALAGIRAGRAA